ncbi:hypothetical protein RND71_036924 [Anisodus tanguticus]|uniref:Uncharacterized protein n=1 Tax=Anisodus tanguticus TaxID=243964 RepID=A0AAE1R231_9SOLA|nr:hypothetical protein RND71_036924 [Anisodus tanguticus]
MGSSSDAEPMRKGEAGIDSFQELVERKDFFPAFLPFQKKSIIAQVYLGVPFTRYTILGDDIVIGDERVVERYRELISPLNVPFSLEKSLVSSVGALEFSKRFFVRGVTKDFFPVSCHMLRSLVSSISLVPVMRAIMSKDLPLSYRLREAGYRVYTRRTTPPRRH